MIDLFSLEQQTLQPEQALFLERIRCAGGVAFVARNCRDVFAQLDNPTKKANP